MEINKRFTALFHPHPHPHTHPNIYAERLARLRTLEQELRVLLGYLQVVLEQGLQSYFSGEENFEHQVF